MIPRDAGLGVAGYEADQDPLRLPLRGVDSRFFIGVP
jgi:hypothetical protein